MAFFLFNRTKGPIGLLLAVFVLGTGGYYLLGAFTDQEWGLLDCAFQTAITATTVGYGDHLGATTFTAGKIYTMFLIVSGMGATLYSVSALTAFIVEGNLGRLFRERKMKRMIEDLSGHTIICGAGRTGTHVIEEHHELGKEFVVMDADVERLKEVEEHHPGVLTLHADATDEEDLRVAGIGRASSLVAALGTDKDNLYLTVTARFLATDLNIVVRVLDHDAAPKFEAAGATAVVSPTYLGGLRLAAQVLQPRVVDFLDGMLQSSGDTTVMEAVVQEHSELAGRTLAESRLAARVGLLVVALRYPGDSEFTYSPPGDAKIPPGTLVVVIGPRDRGERLEILSGERV